MSLSDLTDDPLPPRTLSHADAEYLAYVENLLGEDGTYAYATATIEGIVETIKATQRVTQGQRDAIRNIVRGGDEAQARRDAHRPTRRYEGWTRQG